MSDTQVALTILISAAVTIALRFLPFVIFSGKRKVPKIVTYLGKYLPFAIIAMLVVYCLKSVSFIASPFGIPEFVGVITVAVLHIWKRNTLLSIAGGTVFYMLLVQFIF